MEMKYCSELFLMRRTRENPGCLFDQELLGNIGGWFGVAYIKTPKAESILSGRLCLIHPSQSHVEVGLMSVEVLKCVHLINSCLNQEQLNNGVKMLE
jgi:hypothetical protein